jgi:uncharacterized protein (TIGR02391 family)
MLRGVAQVQAVVNHAGLGSPPKPALQLIDLFDALVTDPGLIRAARKLYRDEHYARAVHAAYQAVNNLVKKRVKGRVPAKDDGTTMMRTAFSANGPVLALNAWRTQSERDEQQGYMDIFAGCMMGIRNPRAHEQDWTDEPIRALEMLIWANHLVHVVNRCKLRRVRKATPGAPSAPVATSRTP